MNLRRSFQLSGKPRLKPIADGRDIEDLIIFMWKDDSHKFRRDLDRIKLHFYILLLAYTAAWPGAIIESSAYARTNEALTYRVINFPIVCLFLAYLV